MSFSFDKFMSRITEEEAHRFDKVEPGHDRLSEERAREIDPNRRRIMGREHWMNRTRGTWGAR
jgi:hypothetical protein